MAGASQSGVCAAAKAQAGIKNTATAFGLLLDAAERQIDELVSHPEKNDS
jgi:hypothetical protein